MLEMLPAFTEEKCVFPVLSIINFFGRGGGGEEEWSLQIFSYTSVVLNSAHRRKQG